MDRRSVLYIDSFFFERVNRCTDAAVPATESAAPATGGVGLHIAAPPPDAATASPTVAAAAPPNVSATPAPSEGVAETTRSDLESAWTEVNAVFNDILMN